MCLQVSRPLSEQLKSPKCFTWRDDWSPVAFESDYGIRVHLLLSCGVFGKGMCFKWYLHVLWQQEPFQHESLLIDRKEHKLTKAEKKAAKKSYEEEKRASVPYTRPSYAQYYPASDQNLSSIPAFSQRNWWVFFPVMLKVYLFVCLFIRFISRLMFPTGTSTQGGKPHKTIQITAIIKSY